MPNFTDLPTEIWLLIAWYISNFQLFRLKSLNSLYLNCWMDRHWEVLEIEMGPKTKTILQRVVYVYKNDILNCF